MKNAKIGDVVEIKTAKGLVYAHYSHKHKQYGALLRVFGVFHDKPLRSHAELLGITPTFMCFFPLNAAVRRGIVFIVDNISLTAEAQKFPIFRSGHIDRLTRKVAEWWLWDGEKAWWIGDLNADQRRLSIRGVWNDTLLIERIESGWTPEDDPT